MMCYYPIVFTPTPVNNSTWTSLFWWQSNKNKLLITTLQIFQMRY